MPSRHSPVAETAAVWAGTDYLLIRSAVYNHFSFVSRSSNSNYQTMLPLGPGSKIPQMKAGLEILHHSLYRYRKPRHEVDEFVNRLREHLSFTVAEDVEDIRPPGGIGPAPELPAVDIPTNGPNLVPDPVPEEPAPQSSDDS